jgi:hypothetical protein
MENSVRPAPANEKGGYFFTAMDGSKIYIREYIPVVNPAKTVYIMSGISPRHRPLKSGFIRTKEGFVG